MSARQFPILKTWRPRELASEPLPYPPWDWVEKFAERIRKNHHQTLERLAERGGLDPVELWLAAHDHDLDHEIGTLDAIRWLQSQPWLEKLPSLH